MNGKGDKIRKKTVSQEVWDNNWENIFRKKENHGSGSKGKDKHNRRK